MHIQFGEVRSIPIDAVLSLYKVEARKRSETELVANCPFASHKDAAHQQWTLAISIPKNRWYCHSETCRAASNKPKGGDVIDLIAMLDNLTALDAAKKLAEMFALNGISKNWQKSDVSPVTLSPPLGNKPLAFELKGIDLDHPFLKEKGISIETAREYGVGFFPGAGSMKSRIVFPLIERGKLVGYAGRTILDVTPDNPKWKLPAGLHKTFVYGLERCDPAKLLMLVESPWGVLWAHQNRFQGAALLGSSMSEAQEACLDPFREIVVCMDNDDAGREAAKKICERLRPKHKVHRAYLNG